MILHKLSFNINFDQSSSFVYAY